MTSTPARPNCARADPRTTTPGPDQKMMLLTPRKRPKCNNGAEVSKGRIGSVQRNLWWCPRTLVSALCHDADGDHVHCAIQMERHGQDKRVQMLFLDRRQFGTMERGFGPQDRSTIQEHLNRRRGTDHQQQRNRHQVLVDGQGVTHRMHAGGIIR